MKTQQQAQAIYDKLIDELQSSNDYVLIYAIRNISGCRSDRQSPLEHFLTSMQTKLASADFDKEFLSQVYAEAFHTGDIPRNRNHIAMTFDLTLDSQPTSPLLKLWIDLDTVATLTNNHFHIKPPYRFYREYDFDGSTCYSGFSDLVPLTIQKSRAVNSVYCKASKRNLYLYIGCICCGFVSGYALLIAALAVTSIITLSSAGIYTALGISALAGLASYGLFRSRYIKTATVFNKPNSENIIDIFQQHFESTFKPLDTAISPQDRFEIIDEPTLLC